MKISLLCLLFAGVFCRVFGDEQYITGIIKLSAHRHNAELYYILFKSRDQNPKAPLIWHFEGGPGQSSMHGLFLQNGPFRLQKDLSLQYNEFSFNNIADVLYVDQPVGTGFSNCTNTSWIPNGEGQLVSDLVSFLQSFLKEHEEYKGRPLFLNSQGYGAHFVLPFAEILASNMVRYANLQGITLGNPWIRPELQLTSLPGFSRSIMNCSEFKYIAGLYGFIIVSIFIDLDLDIAAYDLIQIATAILIGVHNHEYNTQDVRIRCEKGTCYYNFTELNQFLDKGEVRNAMNTANRPFNYSSHEVFLRFLTKNEFLSDKSASLIKILEKNVIPIYIYGGVYDWTMNSLGLDQVVGSLHWDGRDKINSMEWKSWYSDGTMQGKYKHWKGFYYVQVINAGHYVGMDVPSFTLDLMSRIIYGAR